MNSKQKQQSIKKTKVDPREWVYVKMGTLPRSIPAGRVLVHNHLQHTLRQQCGLNGFRAWTQKPDDTLIECKCGWSGLPHYRKRFIFGRDVAEEDGTKKIGTEVIYRVAGDIAVTLMNRTNVSRPAPTKEQVEELADKVIEEAVVMALSLRDAIEDPD